jgi:hypothetical protein
VKPSFTCRVLFREPPIATDYSQVITALSPKGDYDIRSVAFEEFGYRAEEDATDAKPLILFHPSFGSRMFFNPLHKVFRVSRRLTEGSQNRCHFNRSTWLWLE